MAAVCVGGCEVFCGWYCAGFTGPGAGEGEAEGGAGIMVGTVLDVARREGVEDGAAL